MIRISMSADPSEENHIVSWLKVRMWKSRHGLRNAREIRNLQIIKSISLIGWRQIPRVTDILRDVQMMDEILSQERGQTAI
eukprot:10800630-Karenia_brevis.AAC.1